MNLRTFATPLAIGAFLLSAVTGVVMFFEVATQGNKVLHEWFGWALVLGVALHVTTNFRPFTAYFSRARPLSLAIIGVFATMLTFSFFAPGKQGKGSPSRAAVQALTRAPLSALSGVTGQTPEAMTAALVKAGFKVAGPEQTLAAIAGDDREDQDRAMAVLFPAPARR
jgi:hypothetical protein